ncbi:Endonuclease/exonuclease/phosphatase [Cinara cedri]|uniref:Endonuclease/exonuclease/phosphatase n=1 Tax=Cinara cedri TaxID=506608 RepID=A0A5E4MZ64_9HEMI|nr:Endonuclease/exonuclease/phosphatase [Cinara cedri]
MQNNSFTSQSLVILLWNSNGLQNHKNELAATLHEKRIDIALIAEIHFTTRTKFSIPGYRIISTPHPDDTAHAGAGIIIRSSLQFQQEPPIQEDYIQAAVIKLIIKHIPITIASVYCPPKHKINLTQYEQFFIALGHYFIVG